MNRVLSVGAAVVMFAAMSPALIGASAQVAQNKPAVTTVILNEASSGRKLDLKQGDLVVISLAENITTGYSWKVSNKAPLKLISASTKKPGGHAVGQGGTKTWTFKAIAAGKGPLKLDYRRPWEKNIAPIQKFVVTVTVK